jgi:hypothetical protein
MGPRLALALVGLVIVLTTLAALLATRGSGGSSATKPTQPAITGAAAERVLESVWPKRELARTNDNEHALAEVDIGPELRRDISVTQNARDRGIWSERVVRPLGKTEIAIGKQAGYPASFMAAVQTTAQISSGPSSHRPEGVSTALLVFRKPSPTASWKVAMETSYEGTLEELLPPEEEEGRVRTLNRPRPGHPAPAWLQPAGAIAALASYFQHYVDYGTRPAQTPFRPGPWTSEEGKHLAESRVDDRLGRRGLTDRLTYTPGGGEAGIYQFTTVGSDLVCGTVEVSSSDTAPPGFFLYQSPTRHPWGGWLAPGFYSSIQTTGEHQVCLEIEGVDGIRVVAGELESGNLTAAGTRIPSRPPAGSSTS